MAATRAKPTKVSLTKAIIQELPVPQTGRTYTYDATQPGLTICVTHTGRKTWVLYKKVEGRPERIWLGIWPGMTVSAARTAAAEQLGKIAEGKNPAATRRSTSRAPTFDEMFDVYIVQPTRTRSKRPKAARTVSSYRAVRDLYLAPLRHRRMTSVSRQELETWHNGLATNRGKYAANRALGLVRVLYNAGIDAGRLSVNPAARIAFYEETERDRFLQPHELPRFFVALDQEPSEKVRDFIRLMLFTGQRRGDVQAMRWVDVELVDGVWTIPHTKTGRHKVPLIPQAIEILNRRAASREGEYVLPGRYGDGHLQYPGNQWQRIVKRAGLTDLRMHDLRRTLGSWQSRGGTSLTVVGRTLGHSRPETTAIYARLDDAPVRASMNDAVDAILAAAKTEGASDA